MTTHYPVGRSSAIVNLWSFWRNDGVLCPVRIVFSVGITLIVQIKAEFRHIADHVVKTKGVGLEKTN